MVETRSQTDNAGLKAETTHPQPESSTTRTSKRARTNPTEGTTAEEIRSNFQANEAAFRSNANTNMGPPPIELFRGDRRVSVLTGKRPTKAEFAASIAYYGPLKSATEKRAEEAAEARKEKAKGHYISVLDDLPPINPIMSVEPEFTRGSLAQPDDLNTFFPTVTIGEVERLSKVGRADKAVAMWEESLKQHEERAPQLVGEVKKQLERAKAERAAIDDRLEENTRIGAKDIEASAIKARLEGLEWALVDSKFGPEQENIKCAMEGYRNGLIKYSEHLTILYAGHIVDTAPDYSTFARERNERLDRYAEIHGEGWMWYEPPLNAGPNGSIKGMGGVGLTREEHWTNLAIYYCRMGFWKRSKWVSRSFMPPAGDPYQVPTADEPNYIINNDTPPKHWCQGDGPKVSFKTMLDSGATYSSLHPADIRALGVDRDRYSAQSICEIHTANGKVFQRIYEMWMTVLGNNNEMLVDNTVGSEKSMHPRGIKFLGSLCPVTECLTEVTYNMWGEEEATRLSGIIPFLTCYLSSTPSRSTLWLGEDRNDVLGGWRTPGQQKWTIEMPRNERRLGETYYDDPKIRFVHRQGNIIDEDNPYRPFSSRLMFNKDSPQMAVVDSDPWVAMNARRPAPKYAGPGEPQIPIPPGQRDLNIGPLFQWEAAGDWAPTPEQLEAQRLLDQKAPPPVTT